MISKFRDLLLPILIVLSAFLSYQHNFFLVTSDKLFTEHQLDSEQLVLDGILHGSDGKNASSLGHYSRPDIEQQYLSAHQLYLERNKHGVFEEYKSQFGLQFYFFKFVAENLNRDVRFLQSLSALMMSIVVGLFFIAIKREFSLKHAIFFCAPLILSPWVVIFARNLYWVEATWFLPVLVTLFLGKRSLESASGAFIMGGALFAAFLVKLLCGYEYITTIALSAFIPLAFYAMKYRFGVRRGLSQLLICGVSLILALTIAMGIHVRSLSEDWSAGLSHVVLLAKKRLSTQNPESVAKESCMGLPNPEKCREDFLVTYEKSLTSNRFMVAAKYFYIPHFLPWVDRAMHASDDPSKTEEIRKRLKEIKERPTFQSIRSVVTETSLQSLFSVASQAISTTAFLLFSLFVWRGALRRMDYLSIGLLMAFIAPLSWFFLAKAHSYIHYHMNYVLWYLLYVPFGMLLLLPSSTVKSADNRQ